MSKVYVLTAIYGNDDEEDCTSEIHGIYANKGKAEKAGVRLESKMKSVIKAERVMDKYGYAGIENSPDDDEEWLSWMMDYSEAEGFNHCDVAEFEVIE